MEHRALLFAPRPRQDDIEDISSFSARIQFANDNANPRLIIIVFDHPRVALCSYAFEPRRATE